MPYNEEIAMSLKAAIGRLSLPETEQIAERKMFGGLCLLLNGKMLGGVAGNELVFRLADNEIDNALVLRHVREMDFTGKPMRNFVYVDPTGFASDDELQMWLSKSLEFVQSRLTVTPKRQRSAKVSA